MDWMGDGRCSGPEVLHLIPFLGTDHRCPHAQISGGVVAGDRVSHCADSHFGPAIPRVKACAYSGGLPASAFGSTGPGAWISGQEPASAMKFMKNWLLAFSIAAVLATGFLLLRKDNEVAAARSRAEAAERQKHEFAAAAARQQKRATELQELLRETRDTSAARGAGRAALQ